MAWRMRENTAIHTVLAAEVQENAIPVPVPSGLARLVLGTAESYRAIDQGGRRSTSQRIEREMPEP